MDERPIGYEIGLSLFDSEGNTADFTLANTKRGTQVVASADFPVPSDKLAQALATAALAICADKPAASHLDNAVAALHAAITAGLKAESASAKKRSVDDAEAPF